MSHSLNCGAVPFLAPHYIAVPVPFLAPHYSLPVSLSVCLSVCLFVYPFVSLFASIRFLNLNNTRDTRARAVARFGAAAFRVYLERLFSCFVKYTVECPNHPSISLHPLTNVSPRYLLTNQLLILLHLPTRMRSNQGAYIEGGETAIGAPIDV